MIRTPITDTALGQVAVNPRTGTAWVVADLSVVELSEATGHVVHTIKLLSNGQSKAPFRVAVDPVRGTVWVASGGVDVHVNRESTRQVETITGVQNNATGIAIDPAARAVLVADDQDTGSSVFILSEKTDKITGQVGVGFFPSNPAIDPVTGKAYVPIAFRATVTEFKI